MATITTTMAMLKPKSLSTTNSPPPSNTPTKPIIIKPNTTITLPSLRSIVSKPITSSSSSPFTAAAVAGAFFSALSASDAAIAAQQITDIAAAAGGDDNRGLALLIPIVPAVLWVLYNILQPALNQLNRMQSGKGFVVGLGLGGGLAAAGGFLAAPPPASALSEVAAVAAAAGDDSRGLLLLFVVAPAVLWVLYNILQPALNQINRMRSG